nr:unnamed protein product [Callosobruchus analis]CAI5849048.1 unnamed protein product [Callosobruchus analis]
MQQCSQWYKQIVRSGSVKPNLQCAKVDFPVSF